MDKAAPLKNAQESLELFHKASCEMQCDHVKPVAAARNAARVCSEGMIIPICACHQRCAC